MSVNISKLVDLKTAVELSDALPDSVFKSLMLQECPWFEPQYSHRKTWKECAQEYVRRKELGARFVPDLEVVSAEQFGNCVLVEKENDKKTTLANVLEEPLYTEDGVTVDLSRLEEVEEEMDHQTILTSEFLLVYICPTFGCCTPEISLTVKLRNSPGTAPDITNDRLYGFQEPKFYLLGKHLFMMTLDDGGCALMDDFWPKTARLYYISEDGVDQIAQGVSGATTIAVYDGLFHFIVGNEYTCVQTGLCGGAVVDSKLTELSLVVKKSKKEVTWHETVVETTQGKRYVLDVKRGWLVGCEKRENEYVVDAK